MCESALQHELIVSLPPPNVWLTKVRLEILVGRAMGFLRLLSARLEQDARGDRCVT